MAPVTPRTYHNVDDTRAFHFTATGVRTGDTPAVETDVPEGRVSTRRVRLLS